MGGILNDAKIVILSRRQKSAIVSFGTAAAGEADGAPNILAKHESLYTHKLMLTEEVARNFVAPDDTLDAG